MLKNNSLKQNKLQKIMDNNKKILDNNNYSNNNL